MESSGTRRLWETALRDAAGVFSAYIAAPEYGLSSLVVEASDADPNSLFLHEIRKRLDLGRAVAFAQKLPGVAVSSSYRHRIYYRQDRIDGQIHVPRLLVARAINADAPIPVVRATRQPITPENLFVSEAINRSFTVCRRWSGSSEGIDTGTAEERLAKSVSGSLRKFESRKPWSDLRFRPRPSFRALCDAVRGRLKAGIIPTEPLSEILALFATDPGSPSAFEYSASILALPLTEDPQFEDRLFELLCLAWILDSASANLSQVKVWPTHLKGADGKPVMEGRTSSGKRFRVYYQTGVALPEPRWSYEPSGRKLTGIIDILIEVGEGGNRRLILVDAKNRRQSEGEVFYKMLGYQQNFQLPIYNAIAIFPAEAEGIRTKVLYEGDHRVWMARLPLDSGRQVVRTALDAAIKML
jgi:hypothetical protein